MTADQITGAELVRRLRAAVAYIQTRSDLFEVHVAFAQGPGTDVAALASAESDAGLALPPPLREATVVLAGTTWCWALRSELEEEWDADVTGANGGMEWLDPNEMAPARTRLVRAAAALGAPLLPFAKDAGGDATWLAVAMVDGELVAVQAHLDGESECWDLESFLEDWSRGGFRIANRWEDQPETIVDHFVQALDLPEQDWETEDGS